MKEEEKNLQRQIKEEQEQQELVKQKEQSKFGDNQFWADTSLDNQYDLDDLMKELE
jgi:hypothetical protein